MNPNGLKYHVEKGTCKIEEEHRLEPALLVPVSLPIGMDDCPSTSPSPDASHSHADAEGTDEPNIFRRLQDHNGINAVAMAMTDGCGMPDVGVNNVRDHGGTSTGTGAGTRDQYFPMQSYSIRPMDTHGIVHIASTHMTATADVHDI